MARSRHRDRRLTALVDDRLRSKLLSRSRWRSARWLVLAPHADDETLGCAALIHETVQTGQLAGVAFLTDGSGSHRCETASAKSELIARRKQEAKAALRILAPSVQNPLFLAWPDAHPYLEPAQERTATIARLAAFCRTKRVDAIAVTGREEPHCDHVAAFDIAGRVSKAASRPIVIFEYVVWAKQPPGPDFAVVRTASMPLGRRNVALAQHRSQLTPALGEGFRVPGPMLRMPASDLLYTQGQI